jgi:hypothetical protein
MDDATIAGTGGHPEFGELLNEENILPVFGYRICDGTTDNASADDDDACVHRVSRLNPNYRFGEPNRRHCTWGLQLPSHPYRLPCP